MYSAQSSLPVWSETTAIERAERAISEACLLIEEARALQRHSAMVRQRSIDLHNARHPAAPGASP